MAATEGDANNKQQQESQQRQGCQQQQESQPLPVCLCERDTINYQHSAERLATAGRLERAGS
jgi:hypothetical protein